MGDVIIGFSSILFGLSIILFKKKIVTDVFANQEDTTETEIINKKAMNNEWFLLCFGLLAIIVGILSLAGLFRN